MTICLIGFMGSGKTTIGRLLSEELGKSWIDLDSFVEQQYGQPIAEIFAKKGEGYFRMLETKALKCLLKQEIGIISTGGGVVEQPENRALLQKAYTVYLSYPVDTLYQRVQGDADRPLATSYEVFSQRYMKRLPLYEQCCQLQIFGEGKSPTQVTQDIIYFLEQERSL